MNDQHYLFIKPLLIEILYLNFFLILFTITFLLFIIKSGNLQAEFYFQLECTLTFLPDLLLIFIFSRDLNQHLIQEKVIFYSVFIFNLTIFIKLKIFLYSPLNVFSIKIFYFFLNSARYF
jgi:hypothetical protein